MAKKDYMPMTDADLQIWVSNYKTQIAAQGATLGLSPDDITRQTEGCDEITAAIQAVAAQKDALAHAVEHKNEVISNRSTQLRETIARIKTHPDYTEAIGASLGVIGSESVWDPQTYKAEIKAATFGDLVRISFVKNGADGINLYHRQKGETGWQFLARDTRSPYDDHITLAVAGQPEHWEYRAFGVKGDMEIGQPSDIVEIVYG